KRYPEAMIALDELNASFPDEKHVMLARAMCLAELQRPLEAMQICERAVAMHQDPKAEAYLARLHREHGPLQHGPTDLASLLGQGRKAGAPGAAAGLGAMPAIPDVPDLTIYNPPQQSSSKPFYIILGAVAAVLVVLLIGLPLLLSLKKKGGEAPQSGAMTTVEQATPTETGALPDPAGTEVQPVDAAAAAPPVQWYTNYEQGTNVATAHGHPICLFFSEDSEASRAVESSVFEDPGIRQSLSQFINIRVSEAEKEPAAAQYGIEQFPAIVVVGLGNNIVYRAQGGKIDPAELRSALKGMQMAQGAFKMWPFTGGIPVFAVVVMGLLSLLLTPWPLYLTLLFTGKLPHGQFVKDVFSVALVAIGANAVAGFVPCMGIFVLIWILHAVYDLGLVDFLIYFALSTVMWVILALITFATMGSTILSALSEIPAM
ncbi:MAG TPA: hypothetical protein PKW60_00995, partial [Candidatus Hydrogenedentes bacterium]|nr:hypothetical protein [Candidatus Hydrogenedentota bacterium]